MDSISTQVGTAVGEALEGVPEAVSYDVALVMGPQGPMIVVYLQMPSPLLGQALSVMGQVPLVAVAEMIGAMPEMVRQMVEHLRDKASDALAQTNGGKSVLDVP